METRLSKRELLPLSLPPLLLSSSSSSEMTDLRDSEANPFES